eukprot:2787790-Amphidinium_carterae.1
MASGNDFPNLYYNPEDQFRYEPNFNLTGAVTGQVPPPPLSGRSNPYGPILGRFPVTPPAMAGGIPVPENDDMGGPDNPIVMTELVAH